MHAPFPGCHDHDAAKKNFLLPDGKYDWRAIGQSTFANVFASMTGHGLFRRKERLERIAVASGGAMKNEGFLIENLREKWREIPATRQERIFSSDAMRMSDGKLLALWESCRAETCGTEIRGWYQCGYKDIFKGKCIADIGPGIGLDGIFFMENGAKVTFVDIHRDNLLLLERICRLKGLDAEFYYIDNFEKYAFSHQFDVFLAIGSLINAPFDFTQSQIAALAPFLKPGGMVLWLGYPYARFALSGAKDGAEFGKTTDGERTPWAEWYDRAKISRLFGNEFTVSLEANFGADQIEFNVFQLNRADNPSLPAMDRAAFPQYLVDRLRSVKYVTEPGSNEPGNEIFSWDISDNSKSYQLNTYPDDNSNNPVDENHATFKYSTMRDHAALPYFSIPQGLRGRRHFLLELDFPIVADISCQWKILIQDSAYATLSCVRTPQRVAMRSGRRQASIPFSFGNGDDISKIRIVFCPEVRFGEGLLPSRIRIAETASEKTGDSSLFEPDQAQFPHDLLAPLRCVGQDEPGKFLGGGGG